jgi:hypothetical protein
MLATPMAGDQFHLPGVRLVQGGVIQDQDPSFQVYQATGFLPQRLRVGRLSPQQTTEGIMGWATLGARLASGGFGTGETLLGGYQKVNIVQRITPIWVHSYSSPVPISTSSQFTQYGNPKGGHAQLRNSY